MLKRIWTRLVTPKAIWIFEYLNFGVRMMEFEFHAYLGQGRDGLLVYGNMKLVIMN